MAGAVDGTCSRDLARAVRPCTAVRPLDNLGCALWVGRACGKAKVRAPAWVSGQSIDKDVWHSGMRAAESLSDCMCLRGKTTGEHPHLNWGYTGLYHAKCRQRALCSPRARKDALHCSHKACTRFFAFEVSRAISATTPKRYDVSGPRLGTVGALELHRPVHSLGRHDRPSSSFVARYPLRLAGAWCGFFDSGSPRFTRFVMPYAH